MKKLMFVFLLMSLNLYCADSLKVYWGMVDWNGVEFTDKNIGYVNFRAWLEKGTGPDIIAGEITTHNDPGNSVEMLGCIRGMCVLDLSNFTSWGVGNRIYMDMGDGAPGCVIYGQANWTICNTSNDVVLLGFGDFFGEGGFPTYVYYDGTGIEDSTIPESIILHQNYPNPFNPETVINFSLPKADQVTLSVFNMSGQLVNRLVKEKKPAGNHSINFNASDLNSGIYFYTIETGSTKLSKKMLFVK